MLKIKDDVSYEELYKCGYRIDLFYPGEVYKKRLNKRLGSGYIYIFMYNGHIRYLKKHGCFMELSLNDEKIHDLIKKNYVEEIKDETEK